MDDARFDAWTRRRFGLTAGGVFASIAGLAGLADVAARKNGKNKKNKKKKKRCKRLFDDCQLDGRRKCCQNTICQPRPSPQFGTFCCKAENTPCTFGAFVNECCPGFGCPSEGICTRLLLNGAVS